MSNLSKGYESYCLKRYPPTTEDSIVELECKLGLPLPVHYRNFLLNYNGGHFNTPVISTAHTDFEGSDCLHVLYGIDNGTETCDLNSDYNIKFFSDSNPDLIPIGNTPFGNLFTLVFDSRSEDYGDIYYKRGGDPHGWYKVASSMEEFFGLLSELPES